MDNTILDATDNTCPMPLVLITKKLKDIESGDTIIVIADDPMFPPDIKTYCEQTGHILIDLQETEGKYTATIKKT